MPRLHLIRHGRPIVCDASRSKRPLDPERLREVDLLRESRCLPEDADWFSSPERRALETAERLGAQKVSIVPGLREQVRPDEWIDFESIIGSIAESETPVADGWETAFQTRVRVVSAVAAIVADVDRPTVLVGHGTAWTLLVAELTGAQPDIDSWRSMLFPDHCSIEDGHVVSAWSQWTGMK